MKSRGATRARSNLPQIEWTSSFDSNVMAGHFHFLSPHFTIRLLPPNPVAPRSVRRIVINVDVLKSAKIFAGDILLVQSTDEARSGSYAVGIAWPSSNINSESVMLSQSLISTANLTEGISAVIAPYNSFRLDPIVLASEVCIEEDMEHQLDVVTKQTRTIKRRDKDSEVPDTETSSHRRDWLLLAAREILVDLKYITPHQRFQVAYEGKTRRFLVNSILPLPHAPEKQSSVEDGLASLSLNKPIPSATDYQIAIVGWDTQVKSVPSSRSSKVLSPLHSEPTSLAYADVGGLDHHITLIRELIDIPLTQPHLFKQFNLKPPRGILLHGPPGTGKTHLARAIATSYPHGTLTLLIINGPELSSAFHGETESRMRDIFEEARRRAPTIVLMDEVDALCPKREDGGGGVEGRVVATLLTLMDGMDNYDGDEGKVVVVATTNRPNAIDPALRRPGRFDREIEIGIPDASARLSILRVLLAKAPHTISDVDLESMANTSTHGYVGADLAAVVRQAGMTAIKRVLLPISSLESHPIAITAPDLLAAITQHPPSALREYFIETPHVLWSDIGGMSLIKRKLHEAVQWPLQHPESFKRLGVSAPRGVLLYGPPGCSKTMVAKALATESGVNFVAVKGAELINKYVGESERAIREIFRKARGAAPSIIFFDEIDALATSRDADSSSGAHNGVLTSLLNEMDGIQELVGVTVVAATNRPDVLDSALMRPGRLDRILYVGPPDLQARKEIWEVRLKKMESRDPELNVDELAELTEGCSGAEIALICQEAALATMHDHINAPWIPRSLFIDAARQLKRGITEETLKLYEEWRYSH
ncbi:AAA+-type ATPase [Tulasnella sp. JGI-2019a]|nr:AAA+-type ATPase [Tulasnella sp. JGI-2019a]